MEPMKIDPSTFGKTIPAWTDDAHRYAGMPVADAREFMKTQGIARMRDVEDHRAFGYPIRVLLPLSPDGHRVYPHDW
jgi:hypothetical protein